MSHRQLRPRARASGRWRRRGAAGRAECDQRDRGGLDALDVEQRAAQGDVLPCLGRASLGEDHVVRNAERYRVLAVVHRLTAREPLDRGRSVRTREHDERDASSCGASALWTSGMHRPAPRLSPTDSSSAASSLRPARSRRRLEPAGLKSETNTPPRTTRKKAHTWHEQSASTSVPPTRWSLSSRAASPRSSPTPRGRARRRRWSRSPRRARCWSARSPSARPSPTSTAPSRRSSATWARTGRRRSTTRSTPRRRSARGCSPSSSVTRRPTWASPSPRPSSRSRRTSTTPSARPPRTRAPSRASTSCASSTSPPPPPSPTAWSAARRTSSSSSSTSVAARSTCPSSRWARTTTASRRSRSARRPVTTGSAATTGTSASSSSSSPR